MQIPPKTDREDQAATSNKGGRGNGDGGKKLKSGMEANAIALRKASEGNNIAWRGSDPRDIDSTLNYQKV